MAGPRRTHRSRNRTGTGPVQRQGLAERWRFLAALALLAVTENGPHANSRTALILPIV